MILHWEFLCYISKALIFIKIGQKLLFMQKKKYKIFEFWAPPPDLSNTPHCRFLATRLSLIMLLYCEFLCHQSSPWCHHFKSIIFYQNKSKVKLFLKKIFFQYWGLCSQTPRWPPAELQDPRTQPLPHCRTLAMRLILNLYCSYFQILESYNEKLLS